MLILLVVFIISIESGSEFSGFIAIVTVIILLIWRIVDLVLILSSKFKDSQGRYIKLSIKK